MDNLADRRRFEVDGNDNCITLRPRRRDAVWLLAVSVLFTTCGVWMAQTEGWIGYLIASFFAIGITVAIVQLLPGSTYLRIAENGLTFANLFRETTIPWSCVEEFFVITLKQGGRGAHKMVGFNFAAPYENAGAIRRLASALVNRDGGLPDTYGKFADELAEILNRCLRQFRAKQDEVPHATT